MGKDNVINKNTQLYSVIIPFKECLFFRQRASNKNVLVGS